MLVSIVGSLAKSVIFQDSVSASGNGSIVNCLGYKTLLIEVFGANSPTGTISFQQSSLSGNFTNAIGGRLNITGQGSSTTSIPSGSPPQPDLWQFDVTGIDQFMCPLAWTSGNVTVQGRLMA